MLFSLRNIFIGIFISFLFLGVIFVVVSTQVFYSNLQTEVLYEKELQLKAITNLLIDGSVDITAPQNRKILQVPANQRGVLFVRLVDAITGKILLSSDSADEGTVVTFPQPIADDSITVSSNNINDTEVINLIYGSDGKFALWIGIQKLFFIGPTLSLAVQQIFLTVVLISLLTVTIYVLSRVLILTPLASVQDSLTKFGKGNLKTRLPKGPTIEFDAVFNSFNEMANALNAARQHDKHVSEMKSNFVSTAAHQLRTPLTGIQWALYALESGDYGELREEQRGLIGTMIRRNRELITIVGTLLNAASIEEGKFGYEIAKFSIYDLVKNITGEYTRRTYQYPFTFTFNGPEDLLKCSMLGDQQRILWVVTNLLDNAINYSPEGGDITITLACALKRVTVTVADHGIGFKNSDKKSLFKKFYRGGNAVRVKSTGNGLGLFIAKSIIEYHEGKMTATSDGDGKGSSFSFWVPVFDDKKQNQDETKK